MGSERSYGKMWFRRISGLEKSSNLGISQSIGRFQLSELLKKMPFYNRRGRGSVDPSSTPYKWRRWCPQASRGRDRQAARRWIENE